MKYYYRIIILRSEYIPLMKTKYNCTNYGIFELHLLSDNEQILALLSVIVRKKSDGFTLN